MIFSASCDTVKLINLQIFNMTESILRLGAEVRIENSEHSLDGQIGRYLGVSEVPGLDGMHRICFDGKVVLVSEGDFCAINPLS